MYLHSYSYISIQALENRFHPVRAIYIHIMNSIRFFNVPKSFHSYGASPSPIGVYRERSIGYTRSWAGWIVNGNRQTGNDRGNGNEKLNKLLVNRERK